jgi:hypothetical protein
MPATWPVRFGGEGRKTCSGEERVRLLPNLDHYRMLLMLAKATMHKRRAVKRLVKPPDGVAREH